MAVKLKTGVASRFPVAQDGSPAIMRKYFKFNMIDNTTPMTTGTTTPTITGQFGTLPAYSIPLQLYVRVNTAFSSGNIKIGTTADLSTLCSTADVASGTTGLYVVDRYMGTFTTVDQVFYIVTDTSGTGAGDADICMTYLPMANNTTY